MRRDDVTRLEAAVRSANPVPRPIDLVGSTASAAVDLLVRERRDPMTSANAPQRLRPLDVQWRRAWAFVAAFALAIVGIGAAALLLRGGDEVPFGGEPGNPYVEGTVQMGPIDWTKVDTAGASIPHVVALGDGFIGTRIDAYSVEIVTSPDGLVWSPVDGIPLSEGEQILWRAGGPWGAVAEVLAPDPVGIIFTPDGTSWIRSDPASVADLPSGERIFRGIAGADGGLLVAYHLPELEAPASEFLLASTDGENWKAVEPPEEAVFVTGLTSTPFGYLLTAESDSPDRPNPGILSWLSAGGEVWEEVTVTDEFIAGMSTPTAWSGGAIIAGDTWDHATETGASHLWYSPDAVSWSEVDMAPFEGLSVAGFVGSDGGVLAFAHDTEGSTVLLFSADAAEWHQWPAVDIFGKGDIRWGEAASNGNTIVVPVMASGERIDLWAGETAGG